MSERDLELVSLKREFQELREQQQELQSTVTDLVEERETFIDTIAAKTPVSRRQVNVLVTTVGITGAVSYLASEGVLAAGESWGNSTGTNGTDSEPLADANIQDLDVQTLATDELFTEPAGAVLTNGSTQNVANDTLSTVEFDTLVSELNSQADAFADTNNNGITIPNDEYTYGRMEATVRWGSVTALDIFDFQKNGSNFTRGTQLNYAGNLSAIGWPVISTPWVPISNNDTFTVRVRQTQGSQQTISADNRVWFELEAI